MIANSHNNVLLGLRLVEKIDNFPEPTNEELKLIQIQFMSGKQASDINKTKELFKLWLLINGFEDIHTSIRTTLERLFVFKSVENQAIDNNSLNVESVEHILKDKANRFKYPELCYAVHTELNDTLTYAKHLESINNARNCLIHRNGIVTKKDCNNENKDKMVIFGTRFKMFFYKNGEEVLAQIGTPGPVDAALMLGSEEFTIDFNIGDKMDITLKQFVDILNTCIFYIADVEEKLKQKET